MEEHIVVAVDVAKAVFELGVSEEPGRVKLHRRLSRGELEVFFAQARGCTVVMEACGSAHHWARRLQDLGHIVVLLPPHQVRPYVTRNKTDRADAKGILEAYRNADIRPVPVKSIPQQVLGSIHRFRSGWIGARTAHVTRFAACFARSASSSPRASRRCCLRSASSSPTQTRAFRTRCGGRSPRPATKSNPSAHESAKPSNSSKPSQSRLRSWSAYDPSPASAS